MGGGFLLLVFILSVIFLSVFAANWSYWTLYLNGSINTTQARSLQVMNAILTVVSILWVMIVIGYSIYFLYYTSEEKAAHLVELEQYDLYNRGNNFVNGPQGERESGFSGHDI